MSNDNIVLKTRDVVVLACVGGVCIGFGAFSIFHYLTSQQPNNGQQRLAQSTTTLAIDADTKNTDTFEYQAPPSPTHASLKRLTRHYSDQRLYLGDGGLHAATDTITFDEDDLKGLDTTDQIKALREQNYQLQNLLTIARTAKYDIHNPNTLSASDIETIRSIFDSMDADQDGCVSDQELIDIYSKLGIFYILHAFYCILR